MFRNFNSWQEFYNNLLNNLKEAGPEHRERILKDALKKLDFHSVALLFCHLDENDFHKDLNYFLIKGERFTLAEFKECIDNFDLGSYFKKFNEENIWEGEFFEANIPRLINRVFFVHYLQEHFDDFFTELGSMIDRCQEFFKDLAEIDGYGITTRDDLRAFYSGKYIYFSFKFLTDYSMYLLLSKGDRAKEIRNYELKVLNTVSHELAHDIAFEIEEEINSFYNQCCTDVNTLKLICSNSGIVLYRGLEELEEIILRKKYDKRMQALADYMSKYKGSGVLEAELRNFEKLKGVKFSKEDKAFLISLPYRIANFFLNLNYVKGMITEFPAIAIGFLYLLYYYSGENPIETIKEVYAIKGEGSLSRFYIKYLKKRYGKKDYRFYGQFRYNKLKAYFKKYGLERVDDIASFMKEVNNLKDFSGLKKEWRNYGSRLLQIIGKYELLKSKGG